MYFRTLIPNHPTAHYIALNYVAVLRMAMGISCKDKVTNLTLYGSGSLPRLLNLATKQEINIGGTGKKVDNKQ